MFNSLSFEFSLEVAVLRPGDNSLPLVSPPIRLEFYGLFFGLPAERPVIGSADEIRSLFRLKDKLLSFPKGENGGATGTVATLVFDKNEISLEGFRSFAFGLYRQDPWNVTVVKVCTPSFDIEYQLRGDNGGVYYPPMLLTTLRTIEAS